jgi:excisionase family DNA binding protein
MQVNVNLGECMEKLYLVKEAADYLRVNPQTVLRWVREGRLQALRSGRQTVFTEKSLRRFLEPVGAGRD